MDKKRKWFAIGLIVVGLLMISNDWFSLITIAALCIIGFGISKVRSGHDVKTGYILIAVGGGLFVLEHFMMVFAIVLISLGLYYAKIKKTQPEGSHSQYQNITSSIHWDLHPWNLRNTSMWHVLGELDIDLSLAMAENSNNIIMFHGIVGDVDLVIPDDYGVEIDAFIMFGQIDFDPDRKSGMMNRLIWKSPNYDQREQKVKIIISYIVGDVDIKLT